MEGTLPRFRIPLPRGRGGSEDKPPANGKAAANGKGPAPERTGFGTFGGVFTPCTLTILGVIMFLRFGQVVGDAGIWHAIMIVLAAKVITTTTALSLAAISTNTRVRGGGAYYIISRSLGIEFGGSIGVVFFLSQAVSVAMYVIGFTEALLATFPGLSDSPRLIGSIVNVAVFACVFVGASWTVKLQYGILAVLGLAILAFVGGALGQFDLANLQANWGSSYPTGEGWLVAFALFFPAATGIMAGANMSGDLADPGRSIPRGTLMSIGVTAVVYLVFAVLLGAAATRDMLKDDSMIVSTLSWSSALIIAGVFAATLSSALGSMMGAPRILQALARDRAFPALSVFGRASGKNREPRRATFLSFLIAEVGVLLGDLNTVAPIITMFFMITYGALNFATLTEAISNNPSYRPTFRFCHWTTSLVGALGCIATMFLIDPMWAVLSTVTMVVIYRYLSRRDIQSNWGDVQSGAVLERARRNLLALEQERYHPKNWRPAVLALGAGSDDRLHLANYGRWIAGPHGLLIIGHVIVGEPETFLDRQARHVPVLRKFIAERDLEAFPAVTVARSLTAGTNALIQCCGIGAMRPNLVALGWSDDAERRGDFVANVRAVHTLKRSIAILRLQDIGDDWAPKPGPIDVWWLGRDNGALMLLIAHLMIKSDGLRSRTIRLRRMVPNDAAREGSLEHLEELAREARIRVEPEVLVGTNFVQVLTESSSDAALVILGFGVPPVKGADDEVGDDDEGAFIDRLDALTKGVPRVLFVNSAGDMNLTE